MRRRSFYAASSREGMGTVMKLHDLLIRRGWRDAFPWPMHWGHTCSSESCGVGGRADLARQELEAAATCDLFVGISRMGRGSHVELGAALLGPSKRIVLVGVDGKDSVFYESAGVVIARDLEHLEQLLQLPRGSLAP